MGTGTIFTEQEIGDLAGPVRVIAERAGDATAPDEIDALSEALAIAWSPERRAAYDEQRQPTDEAAASTRHSAMALLRLPLELLLSSLVAAGIFLLYTPTAAALALAGTLALAVSTRRLGRRSEPNGESLAFALLGYRITIVAKMVVQYPWLYRRSGLLNWRERTE